MRIKCLILFFFLVLVCEGLFSQSNNDISTNDEKELVSDPRREEIQRYFGYETLFFRYLTLPYDVNINTNQQGRFVDLGFLLITLIPVIIVALLYRHKKAFYISIGVFMAYLVICFSYSLVINSSKAYYPYGENWNEFQAKESKGFIDASLNTIFNASYQITTPLRDFVTNITNENHFLTYPFLFLLAIGLLYCSISRKNQKFSTSILLIIGIAYGFLWLLLSGGIAWYGFLLIPLCLLFIGFYEKINIDHPLVNKYVRRLIFACFGLWSVMAFTSRVSDIESGASSQIEHLGKTILNGSLFPYSMGVNSARKTIDAASPNISLALDKINNDDANIYMIGTSYTFNIRNNVNRIFQDNLLSNFLILYKAQPEKTEFIKMLKTSGFKYIIVDLHTPSLDNTPEQSLTKKFQTLLQTLYENPYIELLATDRVIEYTDSNGQPRALSNVFGPKVINYGSYAVYEIL